MSKEIIQDTDEVTVIDKSKTRKTNLYSASGEQEFNIGFTIIFGSDVDFGKHFHFSRSHILIGRDKSCQIFLKDDKISKRHCEIQIVRNPELEQILIKDLDSTNGTYVNGERVSQTVLKSGDKLAIGDTVLRLNYNDEIEEEYYTKLFNFAATDSLTGLYNRRYVINELENQGKIAKRNSRQFCIIILDIDDFKQINDKYTHLAGDEYLKAFSNVITQCLREQDICGRIGGEEFMIILPETSQEGGLKLANRVRERVSKTEVIYQGHSISTTLSAGISQFGLHSFDRKVLFKLADLALQEAKNTGKNRILSADVIDSEK